MIVANSHPALPPAARLPRADAPRSTGTGASYDVRSKLVDEKSFGSSFANTYRYTVSYEDRGGFFGGAKEIGALVRLEISRHHKGGGWRDEQSTQVRDVTLVKRNGRYEGTFDFTSTGGFGDNQLVIDRAEVAFHAPGNRWDSNGGKNYPLW